MSMISEQVKELRELAVGSQGNFIKTLADERIETACKKSYYAQMRDGLERDD